MHAVCGSVLVLCVVYVCVCGGGVYVVTNVPVCLAMCVRLIGECVCVSKPWVLYSGTLRAEQSYKNKVS